MNNLSLYHELEKLLRMESRYCSEDGVLLKNSIVESALALRPDLIRMLLSHEGLKNNFFTEVDGLLVFDKIKFQKFVMNKRFLPDSYTSFKNKIGLTGDDGDFLAESREVVLSWPYKDCVLEGGQTKEDAKRNEVFWNEILAPDEINRLTEPKVLTNFARYDVDGKHEVDSISKDDNLIIKGNNLLALHSLLKTYRGKVKLIYIDPPYNTGNDGFQYNDSFNHSSWLTFMRNRLTVARELLREDGSIFVQCDDYEDAYLKVLMDDVFGKDNFRNKITWKRRGGSANPQNRLNNVTDYILWFSKSQNMYYQPIFSLDDENTQKYIKERFTFTDEQGRKYMKSPLQSPNPRPNLMYEYKGYKVPTNGWSISKEIMEQWDAESRLVFPEDKSQNINRKVFLDEYKGQPISSLWNDIYVINPMSKEAVDFVGQKPEVLIQRIIDMVTLKGDLVLDYHLGSGTTAAVAHKMERRYIGIEQMDYIETVTVERLKKVIGTKTPSGMFATVECDQGGISKAVGWQGGGSFVYCELAKANQNFADQIITTTTKEQLTTIWQAMQETGFLSWKIDPRVIDQSATDFAALSLDDTKRFLIECLDKNLLYIPHSEIDNTEFAISDTDKQLNSQFYGKL
ncbi:site-specific DNA-methyltransferase [Parabacteroides faecis]|uniref:DNA methyltransferase n=1 Tax=Parabacteroides faecis TaxID=1217282 RepID=UPI0021642D81|nr:site-specific DNA-methyltransferase [Parabacteroides faecis]MCS2891061.1 site-specific DNA-methyltransferase [Parabacteroides faecis]UVQ45289.1 site-specific DNA-methyltransferase [Parabacteroides faecis]